MTEAVMPGVHLLIDFWGGRHLNDLARIEAVLRAAADACGAKVLKVMLHGFGDGGGATGVALLAESHISIHTWPELDYAALDVFVCGGCEAERALEVLRREFAPVREQVTSRQRGLGSSGCGADTGMHHVDLADQGIVTQDHVDIDAIAGQG